MELKAGSKKIKISNVKKVSGLGMARGLMFRKQKDCPNLLFEFKKPVMMGIHSLFVFFPFLAVWLNDKNKILESKIVKPWTLLVSPKKKYSKLLEIPGNNRDYFRLLSVGQKI